MMGKTVNVFAFLSLW